MPSKKYRCDVCGRKFFHYWMTFHGKPLADSLRTHWKENPSHWEDDRPNLADL